MNAPLDPGAAARLRTALDTVSLDDKYALDKGHAFMSGVQALVRLPMLQQQRDQAAGKHTAGFISSTAALPSAATTRCCRPPANTSPGTTSCSSPA